MQANNKSIPHQAGKERFFHSEIKTITGEPTLSWSSSSSGVGSSRSTHVMSLDFKRLQFEYMISSSKDDYEGIKTLHNDALIIMAWIAQW